MAASEIYGAFAPVRAPGAPSNLAPNGYVRAQMLILAQDYAKPAAGVEVGSKIYMADIDYESVLDISLSGVDYGAAGAGVTLSVGDATFPTALMNAVSIAAAGKVVLAGVGLAKFGQPLWQQLGHASLEAAKRASGTSKARIIGSIAGANLANATDLFWKFVGAGL